MTKPVRAIEDMKGLRLRVQQSDLMDRMMNALGAEPYRDRLRAGAHRARRPSWWMAPNNWPSFVTSGHHKVARYYTTTRHTMGPGILIMSTRAWGDLSAEDRLIFRAAAQIRQVHAHAVADLGDAVREGGGRGRRHHHGDIDRKPFEDATRGLRDQMRADPQLRPLIEKIEAVAVSDRGRICHRRQPARARRTTPGRPASWACCARCRSARASC